MPQGGIFIFILFYSTLQVGIWILLDIKKTFWNHLLMLICSLYMATASSEQTTAIPMLITILTTVAGWIVSDTQTTSMGQRSLGSGQIRMIQNRWNIYISMDLSGTSLYNTNTTHWILTNITQWQAKARWSVKSWIADFRSEVPSPRWMSHQ